MDDDKRLKIEDDQKKWKTTKKRSKIEVDN